MRTNKYAGKCERCGVWIEAEQGIIEADPRTESEDKTRWMVLHSTEDDCGARETGGEAF